MVFRPSNLTCSKLITCLKELLYLFQTLLRHLLRLGKCVICRRTWCDIKTHQSANERYQRSKNFRFESAGIGNRQYEWLRVLIPTILNCNQPRIARADICLSLRQFDSGHSLVADPHSESTASFCRQRCDVVPGRVDVPCTVCIIELQSGARLSPVQVVFHKHSGQSSGHLTPRECYSESSSS